jgi:hypothetical protein
MKEEKSDWTQAEVFKEFGRDLRDFNQKWWRLKRSEGSSGLCETFRYKYK